MNIIEKVKIEVNKLCDGYNNKFPFDNWKDHISSVVKNALDLAQVYGADREVVELGALLHDIARFAEDGPIATHNVAGAKIAEEMLKRLGYEQEKIEIVKKCVLHHNSTSEGERSTLEEQCVGDGDALSHFDRIPSLFSRAYKELNLSIVDGKKFVRKQLEFDFERLSENTKRIARDRYNNIIKVLFSS